MIDRIRDGSVVATVAERTLNRLRIAAATARVGRLLPVPLTRRSVEDGGADEPDATIQHESRVGTVVRQSTIVGALESTRMGVESALRTAISNAKLATVSARSRQFVYGSFLYRWLTADPDPEVIVIDLRETASVGPALRATHRGLAAIAPSVASARTTDVLRRGTCLLRERPVRIASLVLFGATLGGVSVLATGDDLTLVSIAVLVAVTGLAAIGIRSTTTWTDIRENRAVKAVAAAFEPPEPPDRTDTDDETPPSSSADGCDNIRD